MSKIEQKFKELCSTPSDINEHLEVLRNLASMVSRVTEFGVRGGVSTVALLAARPFKMTSYDINGHHNIDELSGWAEEEYIDFKFIQKNVLEVAIEPTDMLFIDTLHTYGQLSEELRLHAGKVSTFIVFHDTVSFGRRDEGTPTTAEPQGIMPAIERFLATNYQWKVKNSYLNNNGLMVIKRHNKLA